MIIPVRCFTCNMVLASKYRSYKIKVTEYNKQRALQGNTDNILSGNEIDDLSKEEINTHKQIFESIGVERYCCKRCLISHIDLIDKI